MWPARAWRGACRTSVVACPAPRRPRSSVPGEEHFCRVRAGSWGLGRSAGLLQWGQDCQDAMWWERPHVLGVMGALPKRHRGALPKGSSREGRGLGFPVRNLGCRNAGRPNRITNSVDLSGAWVLARTPPVTCEVAAMAAAGPGSPGVRHGVWPPGESWPGESCCGGASSGNGNRPPMSETMRGIAPRAELCARVLRTNSLASPYLIPLCRTSAPMARPCTLCVWIRRLVMSVLGVPLGCARRSVPCAGR